MMLKSRLPVQVSDASQKQAPKAPLTIKVSRCNSDPLHRRPVIQRSPRPGGERLVINPVIQSDPSSQKKLGCRISDLESQLGNAQEELKLLKGHMSAVKIKKPTTREEQQQPGKNKKLLKNPSPKTSNGNGQETDVFEVPAEDITTQSKKKMELDNLDMNSLKTMLEEKQKQLENSYLENRELKTEIERRGLGVLTAEAKEEDMRLMMVEMTNELEVSKGKTEQLMEKVKTMKAEKEEIEVEMKKLRIQTEQWRKAADAAALVLSEGKEGKIPERWANLFENPVGGGGGGADDEEESPENGKRRISGIKMFGDLWRKKVHK